jgi:metal-dependent amidase/aminoacylase/carboxypeptidase family protein
MKKFNRIWVAAIFGAALTVVSGNAQTVNQRRENQQDRIGQGVTSGQLTAGETANLEGKEARLNHEIRDDREDHNGHLTAGERARVNRQQNKLSRQIYRDKHNARKQ